MHPQSTLADPSARLRKKPGALVVAAFLAAASALSASTVAHWRFEEGPATNNVTGEADVVRDRSGAGNHLRTFSRATAPTYFTDLPFHPVPQSGESNLFALNFVPNRDLYTEGKPLNSHSFRAWTIELSFKPHAVDPNHPIRHQVLLGKDGNPRAGSDPEWLRPPPVAFKILPDGHLELGLVDGAGEWRSLLSAGPVQHGEWHHVAATATATEMAFWLKTDGDDDYVLQGVTPVAGAFRDMSDQLDQAWTVGRGNWDNRISDWFDGLIDEVRISDVALPRSDFLANYGFDQNDARDLQVTAAVVETADADGTKNYFALDSWAPDSPAVLELEASPNLVQWEVTSAVHETIQTAGRNGAERDRVRLVSEIALEEHARHFLRTRLAHDQPEPKQPANPILSGADPDVLWVGDTMWIYLTYRSGEGFMFAFSSKDLVSWRMHGPVLRFGDIDWLPEGKHAWAPGVAARDGKYYLYYSAGPKPSHIGVAVSDSPAGPFIDSGQALLSDNGAPEFEAIDAMIFNDPQSGLYYFYAGGSAGAKLLTYSLNANMTSFRRQFAVDTPPYFTEGAFMHYREGIYYLSYSHGGWRDQSYSVHYATSDTPTGPWNYRGAILVSDDTHKGPGHHSIVHHPETDQWLIVYHRWNNRAGPGPYDGSRTVAIERLHFDEQGLILPVVMTDSGVRLSNP